MIERAKEILEFWFGDVGDDTPPEEAKAQTQKWFKRDDAFDRTIRERFGKDLKRAADGELRGWEDDRFGRLAVIIMLDQFSRNIYRDSPKAFENDEQALELTLRSINEGFDRRYSLTQRHFLYLPLMHSEDFRMQKKSLTMYETLLGWAYEMSKPYKVEQFKNVLEYARRHHDIIERFGRFPHRNQALGRESTPGELAFLNEHGGF